MTTTTASLEAQAHAACADADADDLKRRPPGGEGSDECVMVLQVLHRAPDGLKATQIQARTGLASATVAAVLLGLRTRGRIVLQGKGLGASWRTVQHAIAAGKRARGVQ